MKIKLLYLSLFLVLLSTVSQAQARRSGLGRGISDYEDPNTRRKSSEPVDQVQAYSDHMTKELELDGFQAAIVKNIIKDYVSKTTNIGNEPIPDAAKYDQMQLAVEKMETDILQVLNEAQKVKFQELKDRKNKKGKKSKKDKKKEAEEPASLPLQSE